MKRNYIAGEWLASDDAIENRNPPDISDLIGTYAQATTDQLESALDSARAAQKLWQVTGLEARQTALIKIGTAMMDRADELGELLSREEGKPRAEGRGEIYRAGQFFTYYAAEVLRQIGDNADSVRAGIEIDVRRDPVGIIAVVSPWNFPTATAVWKIAPALAFGNAVIWKPANLVPASAVALTEIIADAGLPDGLFQIVHGDHKVGRAICAHPGIAKISLTGGVDTGRLIMGQSAETLKKVTLELGGKSPLLVFADADFDLAVQTALDANFYTAGEVCSNATRVFVEASIAAEFEAALVERARTMTVGDPMADDVQMGALISEPHLQKVLDYVASGTAEGATLAVGGSRLHPQGFEAGYFMEPTILTNCRDEMRHVREEIFGPVMSVLTFETEEEAVQRANATSFGLGAGLMTGDLARAHRVAAQLESGNVWVNSYNILPPGLPFGGVKQSGFGRENSAYSLEAYSEIKATYIQL